MVGVMNSGDSHGRHRGMHPKDRRRFAPEVLPRLRRAVAELSWLLTRGYSEASALKLVGDRHALTARQRKAVMRCSCSDQQRQTRAEGRVPPEGVAGGAVFVDGFNQLIILESALGGGVLLRGRDRCLRDLASIHGSYRRVGETRRALTIMGEALAELAPATVHVLLDSPVSNSGRLKVTMAEIAEERGWSWEITLHRNPDRELAQCAGLVVSSDGWILDNCRRGHLDLLGQVVPARVPEAYLLDLAEGTE